MADPAAVLEPARFAEWLGYGVTADLLSRVLGVPRLEAACGRLLDGRVGPAPGPSVLDAAPDVAAMFRLDGLALLGLAQRAGAVWHSRAILRIIDGAAVRALVHVIGPSLRLVAIRHVEFSAELPAMDNDSDADTASDPARLAAAIAADGLGCLAAWCARQPPSVGVRVLLRLPCPAYAGADHRERGPAIVDALLGEAA